MSISDTLQSKKYASIAETAAAQAKLSAEKLDNAPDYAAEAEQYAIQAQAAYESTVTASSGAINAANSASTSAIDAANSAASAGSAAEDAVVGYSERSIRTPVGEVISELPAESERQDTLLSFNSTGGIQVKSLNDFASLGSDGKIPVSQIPSVALTEVYTVASESEMLLLVAEEGDIAIRTDISQTFVLLQSPSSALANWKLLLNDALVFSQTTATPNTIKAELSLSVGLSITHCKQSRAVAEHGGFILVRCQKYTPQALILHLTACGMRQDC